MFFNLPMCVSSTVLKRIMNVPQAIIDEAASVSASLLPDKSSARYEREYSEFKDWQKKNEVNTVTEDVVLSYLNQLATKFSPNTLWTKWSMIKSCLEVKENLSVDRYHKVIAFLKKRNKHYVPKKAKVLTKEQVEKFLLEAPDDQWLLAKVITVCGIFGLCRCNELLTLTFNDVEVVEKYIIITLRETKNGITRRFTITDDECIFKPCALFRKYLALRPRGTEHLRLFLTYRNGKCVALNAGQHTVGGVPKKIAQFLGLNQPELYTGHSFRRTGATRVVESGGDSLTLKRAGGWKSSKIAESYVEDSINNRLKVSKRMFSTTESTPSTSTSTEILQVDSSEMSTPGTFSFSGIHNCTMIFNMYDKDKSFLNVNDNK